MKALTEAGALATAPKEGKVNDSIRPDNLSFDHTPAEFDTWKRDFETSTGVPFSAIKLIGALNALKINFLKVIQRRAE